LHFLVREPLFAPLRTNPRVIKLLEAHGVDAKTLGTTMGFADPDPAGDPTGRRRGPRADRPDRRPEAGEPQDGDEPRERGNKPARGGRADRPRRGDRGPDAPVEPSPP
jgi:hypothetical protein